MANQILFLSTILASLIFIYNVCDINSNCAKLLILYYTIGFISSLLNHGFTHDKFVLSDRIIMVVGFFINIILILNIKNKPQYLCLFGLFLSVFNYFIAKYYKSSIPHICTHLIIVLVNLEIIYYYEKNIFTS